MLYKQIEKDIIFFNTDLIKDIDKIILWMIEQIVSIYRQKEFKRELEERSIIHEDRLIDFEEYNLKVKKWILNDVLVGDCYVGVFFHGNLSRVLNKYFKMADKEDKTSLSICIPPKELIEFNGNIDNPFFFVTENSSKNKTTHYFVHEITHWYTYKYISKNPKDENAKYREALAFLAQRDILEKTHKDVKDTSSKVHQEALGLIRSGWTKETIIEHLKKHDF